ncbi:MAG: carbamoyl phosphate synthase small subunit [Clostridia bacterium]|nr:carbamoyl phosphate synthase small subunit [Clostridia bacterium]
MAYLVLSNGEVFEGKRIGAKRDSIGEIVFTTGMVGYLETLTDPSYAGQIVIQTFPLIGNYGVIPADFEGKSAVLGYVVRNLCDTPSNFRSEYELNRYLEENNIPGICGVDTRQLTRIIRKQGVMNAIICDEIPENLDTVKNYSVVGVVNEVTTKQTKTYEAIGEKKHDVVLIDYGAKKNIVESLRQRGCEVKVVPSNTPAENILALNPNGIMLSNGPGDPAENTYSIEQIKKLVGKKPIFGICLGHQLTALALGGTTYKLKYGHRGGNQPVKDLSSGRTYITSQNHGYAVDNDSVKDKGSLSFINANDGSCEGMDYSNLNCFTVQFHPEACSGPHDTSFLFDRFIKLMEDKGNA